MTRVSITPGHEFRAGQKSRTKRYADTKLRSGTVLQPGEPGFFPYAVPLSGA
jgi:hypothetical protein